MRGLWGLAANVVGKAVKRRSRGSQGIGTIPTRFMLRLLKKCTTWYPYDRGLIVFVD
jgi:hypothetical protein